MNYFTHYTAAERYSKARPNFHPNTINRIKEYLLIENKFDSALDIACGTGLSTQALLSIATHVYGTDNSKVMLDVALQKENINYQEAQAEKQPFADHFFDLITVCSGVHWFDIDKFLLEANRLLKNNSFVVLYDNFFLGEMEGNPELKNWYNVVYLNSFPAPARNDNYIWTNDKLNRMNFDIVNEQKFNNAISFNKKELGLYFTTQSNIISAVEKKRVSYTEVDIWLNKELSIFFANEDKREIVHFANWIKYLKKRP